MIISKAQTWSVDIILAVVIFMVVLYIFYVVFSGDSSEKTQNLKQEASSVIKQISSGENSLRIVNNNEVNISKISELKNLSYDELKSRLRVDDDFCIFFEDDKGNIVLINNSYKGIGASSINASGTPCSQK